ncbi:hypothetical protein GOP47_0014558 [Adiantum capillus-veneris]|uniref:Cilia- and flagella-associated protein 61 N-terminal domain-containing protein n=1 Tax=Adiantum capillus-veneris TaxID=13818 RepID=A0A9D4ULP8_ADICA|nr:hypothetical protein GOP47_0014558 [Adiantum capillus-veneris]
MAEPCDAGAVEASFRSAVPRLRAAFGFVDFSSLIEHSLYPLVGLSNDDEVIAFAAFNDTPSVPGGVFGKRVLDSKAWAAKEASAHGYNPENSLWIEVCVASSVSPEAQEKYLKQFLSALFKLSPETRVVLDLSPFEHANSLGILKPISRSQEMDLVLLMCLQSTVLPSINIKQAIVENYDDLFPIVENAQKKGSPLSNIPNSAAPVYPFAMARLIAAQDAKNNVLAAEIDSKLVGVIAVTHELDSKFFIRSMPDVSNYLATIELFLRRKMLHSTIMR